MGMKTSCVAAGVIWALCVPFSAAAQDVTNGPGRYQFRNFASGSTKGRLPDLSELWKTNWKKGFDLYRVDQTNVIPFFWRPTSHPVWDIRPATGKAAAGPLEIQHNLLPTLSATP